MTSPSFSLPAAASRLRKQGVILPDPSQVYVDGSVDPGAIGPGTVLYPGTRLSGSRLSIGPDCHIGSEGPATIEDAQLDAKVTVAAGFVAGSVLLEGCRVGSGAHIRPGCLLEESANVAHSVGLKQTVLLPYVTLGSLINFCDILMAGGTGPDHHSEVGSSYIHFNFTPHGDKATASLLGEVPGGVMLDRDPVFLGGQGGLVGPVRMAYGTVVGAGTVLRQDVLETGLLVLGADPSPPVRRPVHSGCYRRVDRVIRHGLHYIGQIAALEAWYRYVRLAPSGLSTWYQACCEGALRVLDLVLAERIARLAAVAARMPTSIAAAQPGRGQDLHHLDATWPDIEARLRAGVPEETGADAREAFLTDWDSGTQGIPYLETIQGLETESKKQGTSWLQQVVEQVARLWTYVPSTGEQGS